MPTFNAKDATARISKAKQFLSVALDGIDMELAYLEHVNYEADPQVGNELTEIHIRVEKLYERLNEALAAWREKH